MSWLNLVMICPLTASGLAGAEPMVCGRLLWTGDPLQAAEVTIAEPPSDHVLGNLSGAGLVELVAIALESGIEPRHCGLHAGCDEGLGFHNHDAGSPAVEIAIVQPE
jgi:hypothetical protein